VVGIENAAGTVANQIENLADPQQVHTYASGKNAPTTFADPEGKMPYQGETAGPGPPAAQHGRRGRLEVIRRKVVEREGRAPPGLAATADAAGPSRAWAA
jgi:hypothetical protein